MNIINFSDLSEAKKKSIIESYFVPELKTGESLVLKDETPCIKDKTGFWSLPLRPNMAKNLYGAFHTSLRHN